MANKNKIEKLYLKYTFDELEKKEIAENLAIQTRNLDGILDAKKSAAAPFKSEEEAVKMEINTAARKYSDGYEMRNIECKVLFNYDSSSVTYVRIDNHEIVSVRKMRDDERQMKIEDTIVDQDELDEQAAHDAHGRSVQRTMSAETSSF